MEDQRYQDVLEEHAHLAHRWGRAVFLLLLAIGLGLAFGPTPSALDRYLIFNSSE